MNGATGAGPCRGLAESPLRHPGWHQAPNSDRIRFGAFLFAWGADIVSVDSSLGSERTMKFGFMLFTRDLAAVGEIGRLAEARGFALIGIADSPALSFDPYMALTLAAVNTSRARVGTAVTNPQTRHPLIVANLAASLEQLAPGRSFLGLGTGWSGVRHAGAAQARLADLKGLVQQVR